MANKRLTVRECKEVIIARGEKPVDAKVSVVDDGHRLICIIAITKYHSANKYYFHERDYTYNYVNLESADMERIYLSIK
jgi:hypothetical protein